MKIFSYRCTPRKLILILIAGAASTLCSTTMAIDTLAPESRAVSQGLPGPVGLAVSGASAGITTAYFESAIADAITSSEIFSAIDQSEAVEVTMRMIGASGTFSSSVSNNATPYLLKIRIIKVDTPSFSTRMTVSMNAVWELYRTAGKTTLLHENIYSTYTGGAFEGGIHGANRVRVALEGAARNNIRIGMEMLASMDLEQE